MQNSLDQFLLAHMDMPVEEVMGHFPMIDLFTIRKHRRRLVRQQDAKEAKAEAFRDPEALVPAGFQTASLTKPALRTLQNGWFRRVSISLKERPRPKLIWEPAGEQYLVMSDGHAPDIDRDALDVAIQVGLANRLAGVILAGDWFDCHALSKYTPAAHRPYRWVDERDDALPTLIEIRESFPDVPIDFIIGNHDIRPEKFIASQAPQLQGLFTLPQLLGIEDLGFRFPDNNRVELAGGQLITIHGSRVRQAAAASVQAEVTDYGLSVIMGHCHRRGWYEVTKAAQTIRGEQPLIGVELGCLSSLTPDYIEPEKVANWQHGAALVTVYDDGSYDVEPIRIHHGRARFRGRLFTSRWLTA